MQDLLCPLCQLVNEDHDHIFFQCDYAAEIWRSILQWQEIRRNAMNWTEGVQWGMQYMKGKSSKALMYRMAMSNVVYHIWLERNARIFKQQQKPASYLIRLII
ncbi:hypothetical protein MTR67_018392 [Solanum verrucosum]|uniref:Reverse transcriptase zinc-binding domain-containing protein n=1 Tax=Solanum verrucosum TaxID=315347 RepID=A0AAF0QLM9_SOLVR|nr:hypothetical protein MTR67_018392 [Solanum verrucosum]